MYKILFVATYHGLYRERAEWTRDTWGESDFGGSGEKVKALPPGSLCWVIPQIAEAILFRQSIPLQVVSV